jgi:hypothetical protein
MENVCLRGQFAVLYLGLQLLGRFRIRPPVKRCIYSVVREGLLEVW